MNYIKYANKAYSKIKQYGSPITIIRSGSRVYNPETNEYEDNGEKINGYSLLNNFNQKNIDGTNIKFGDVLFFASLEKPPKTNDSVLFNGKTYTVVNVSVFAPNGVTDIFYNIQAR